MLKQIRFFRKRPDMTMDPLAKKNGAKPAPPNAVRYVRRDLVPETNPVTGEVHDPGYDCIMEIRWNRREELRELAADRQRPHASESDFAHGVPDAPDRQPGT